MLNLLVAVEHSLESSFALRTVCLLGLQIRIQPIYVYDPPARDLSLGAGWAWKSWERETRQMAKSTIDDLVLAERNQCTNIEDPIIVMGDAVHELTGHFWRNRFDLLVVGAPFREWGPLALSRRFCQAAKKARQDVPLLVVRHLKNIRHVVAMTDGSLLAEKALALLARLNPFLSCQTTLVGLPRSSQSSEKIETANLENALAGLKEKGIDAAGRTASSLSTGELQRQLKAADLVVCPFICGDHHIQYRGVLDHDVQAALFYLGED